MSAYMEAELGYSGVKSGTEWVHIKETMMMMCHVQSLRVYAGKFYVATKLKNYVERGCKKKPDGIKISNNLVKSVATLFEVTNMNLWENYFRERLERHWGFNFTLSEQGCANNDVVTAFTAEKFSEYVDSPVYKPSAYNFTECDELEPWQPTAMPTIEPPQSPSCTYELELLNATECPSDPNIGDCLNASLSVGDLCEGDGECGTDIEGNNCDIFEVYRVTDVIPCPAELELINAADCPENPDIWNCLNTTLSVGDLCEGDGECQTQCRNQI